jgi:tetratricopeptide (TPR) repeat protein
VIRHGLGHLCAAASLALVVAASASAQSGEPSPGSIVKAAEHAVYDDSAGTVEARWRTAAARNPADREAMLGLATLARETYAFATAESLYSVLLAGAAHPPDAWTVQARLGLYRVSNSRGDKRRSDSLLHVAIAETRRVGDREAEIAALVGFTNTRSFSAPALFATMDTIARLLPPGDSRDRAEYLCRLGVYKGVGGSGEASDLVLRGTAMARHVGERRLVGHCLEGYGLVQSLEGRNDSALAVYDSAAAYLRATHEHAGLARLESRRSDILQAYGRLGEAKVALRRILAEAGIAKNQQRVANAYGGMGMLALRVGDLPTAAAYFDSAATLNDSLGEGEGGMIARQNRAEVLAASGDLPAAQKALEETLDEAHRGDYLEDEFIARQRLARVAMRRRDWTTAARQLAAADSMARSHGLEEVRGNLVYDRGLLALGRGELGGAERLFSAFLAKTAPDDRLLRYATRTRLAEVWAGRGDLARAEREMTEANGDLEAWRAALGADDLRRYAYAATALGEYDSQRPVAAVIAALAAGGRADAALTLAEQRRARTLADRLTQADALRETNEPGTLHRDRGATAAEIVAAMPDDSTALLEYAAGSEGVPTTLFVVTRGGIEAHRLPPADSLAEPVARFVALLEASEPGDALAASLGRAVLGPAESLPAGISRLVIVPDGPLHRLPFDALRLPGGQLAIERWAFGLAPSAAVATVLRRPREPEAPADAPRVLALGDPAFARERAGGGQLRESETFRGAFDANGGLPRLSASGDEVRDVARYSRGQAVVRLRQDASEAWLKHASLAPFSVIHLATHALVDESSLARTALALAPGSGEDGFLSPADLASLRLHADLVVLSACRTAGGVMVAGEGMQGLTTPLIEAGARAVVATQWRIGDRSTVRLVDDLYAGLGRGLSAAAALREAKLAAMKRGAPAGEWAAFTVVGDPLVRVPLREPSSGTRLSWMAGAGVVVILAAYFAARRWRRAGTVSAP